MLLEKVTFIQRDLYVNVMLKFIRFYVDSKNQLIVAIPVLNVLCAPLPFGVNQQFVYENHLWIHENSRNTFAPKRTDTDGALISPLWEFGERIVLTSSI